ncbi:MAG: DUF58 domain-containing protein [Chromatiales bacterium]|nr:DUF58 domain-containing protein [Chromatiales bacterium]
MSPGPLPAAPTPVNDGVHLDNARLIALRRRAGVVLTRPRACPDAGQSGNYASPFRGRGMDFEETRVYQAGDDVRHIDWRVTARSGIPHTKLYREERERPVLFFVDVGRSMRFGTRRAFKSVAAAEAAAFLAWSAVALGDRVGGIVASDGVHRELSPRPRTRGAIAWIRALVDVHEAPLANTGGRAVAPLERFARIARPGSLSVILSDFLNLGDLDRWLARLAEHTDPVLVQVYDPVEARAPRPGMYCIGDDDRRIVLDTTDRSVVRDYEALFAARQRALVGLCRKFGARFVTLETGADVSVALRSGLACPLASTWRAA